MVIKDEEYLNNHIAIRDILFVDTDPDKSPRVCFWAKANGQHYLSTYDLKSDRLRFLLYGEEKDLGDKTLVIKDLLFEQIGKEYGCN